jgi:hypothetical protein
VPPEHTVVQLPQWAPSMLVFASQPSESMPLQLPKPGLQARTAHAPVAQVAAAFVREHRIEQPPQLASVFVCDSQPLMELKSQLPHPTLQMGLQNPDAHDVLPCGFVQMVLQLPQWLTS